MFFIPSKIMVSILSNIIIDRKFEIIHRTYQIKIEVSKNLFCLISQNLDELLECWWRIGGYQISLQILILILCFLGYAKSYKLQLQLSLQYGF